MIGDLATAITALRGGGPINITLVADSIGQGLSQIAYQEGYAGLLERNLRSMFPNKAMNFQNLSIPGVSWGEVTSDTYTGVNFLAPPGHQRNPPVPALWSNGVVSNQSWLAQVEATDPHLLIFELGINASSDLVSTAALIRQLIGSRTPSWTPKPSIVFVTPAIPSTILGGNWQTIADDAQGGADALREIAAEFNATVVDVNALYRLVLNGEDVTRTNAPVPGLIDFPAWQTSAGVRPSLVNGTLDFSSGWGIVHSPTSSSNVELNALLAPNVGGVGALWYRFRGPNTGYLFQVQTYSPSSPAAALFHNGSPIMSVSLAAANEYRVHIEAVGCRHKIWVNGVLVIDVRDYKQWRPGKYGVEATGGTVSAFSVGAGYPVVSSPLYSELELLGTTDPGSTDGNGINHPTALGHREVYFEAFKPLLAFLQTAARLP